MKRNGVNLSSPLERGLKMYALAAGAAGVGALALAQPAEARIVYTATNVTIVGPNGSYNLDLNNDGQIDFTIRNTKRSSNTEWNSYALWDEAVEGNGIECNQIRNSAGYALALARGSKIGAGRKVCRTAALESVFGTYQHGNWKNATNRYLGVKFNIKGQTHYGWARLSVRFKNGIRAILTGFAYETIPNKPIIAGRTHAGNDGNPADPASAASVTNPIPETPKPASLGALAMGAPGLSIWRRKEWALA
jgi:hypothetical protein